MDSRKFDDVTRSFAESKTRRGIVKSLAGGALAGLVAFRAVGTGAQEEDSGGATCNTDEKCEAKCGRESALCCNGTCIFGGCGPDRVLNPRNCQCCRVDERGRPTNTGCRAPKFCGA